jgi:preprotein translocase subunit SecA
LSQSHLENVHYQHADFNADLAPEELLAPTAGVTETEPRVQPRVNPLLKVGRNDPCTCGSGKKYKQGHGKLV